MDKQIIDIYNSLQEIAWYFGSHGINGECCDDLSYVEFMALKRINGNIHFSIQEIGNALNFTKSGATRIVNRLENKGYVVRENSSVDGRICCVSITTKGMEAISRIKENYTAYLEEVLKGFEPQKIEHIKDALEMLIYEVQKSNPFNSNNKIRKGGECY